MGGGGKAKAKTLCAQSALRARQRESLREWGPGPAAAPLQGPLAGCGGKALAGGPGGGGGRYGPLIVALNYMPVTVVQPGFVNGGGKAREQGTWRVWVWEEEFPPPTVVRFFLKTWYDNGIFLHIKCHNCMGVGYVKWHIPIPYSPFLNFFYFNQRGKSKRKGENERKTPLFFLPFFSHKKGGGARPIRPPPPPLDPPLYP